MKEIESVYDFVKVSTTLDSPIRFRLLSPPYKVQQTDKVFMMERKLSR